MDNSTIFPAVNFIDELDIAMIKTQQSFFLPLIRYHSIIYATSPTFSVYIESLFIVNFYLHDLFKKLIEILLQILPIKKHPTCSATNSPI